MGVYQRVYSLVFGIAISAEAFRRSYWNVLRRFQDQNSLIFGLVDEAEMWRINLIRECRPIVDEMIINEQL